MGTLRRYANRKVCDLTLRKRHRFRVQESSLFVCLANNRVLHSREVLREDLRGSQIDLGELKAALAALARATKERVCCHTPAD